MVSMEGVVEMSIGWWIVMGLMMLILISALIYSIYMALRGVYIDD